MKILATADIHLGRRSSQLPESAADFASCSRAWLDIVDFALTHKVDCVLLAGDIIDENNRFYEAIGPLETGIRKLTEKYIHVIAVAGNHDCEILPQAASSIDRRYFHLLGEGGKWEQKTVSERAGTDKLQVFGWSFPGRHVKQNPLSEFPREQINKSAITIGLMHADKDTSSNYCPVLSSEFYGLGVPLWILGHVHKQSDVEIDANPKILYPGSPQGMDPGETGHHGFLLFETSGQKISPLQTPSSPILYADFNFDITGIKDEQINPKLSIFLKEQLELINNNGVIKFLSARIKISGRTDLSVKRIMDQLDGLLELEIRLQDVSVWINKCTISILPNIDLDEISHLKSFDGCLARLIKNLESDSLSEDEGNLLGECMEAVLNIRSHSAFGYVNTERKISNKECRNILLKQAWKLLDILDNQKRSGIAK